MSVQANLLPEAFLRRRRDRRRRRVWVFVCLLLTAAEGVTAVWIGALARDVRKDREQTSKINASVKQEKVERDSLQAKADRLAHDTRLAERLREKHYWSRWLGSLSLMVPKHVMLTVIETDPAQFGGAPSAASRGPADPSDADGVRVVRLRGSAAQHENLMALYKAMNGVKWFRSVQLEEARRQKVADRDAIGFALACDW